VGRDARAAGVINSTIFSPFWDAVSYAGAVGTAYSMARARSVSAWVINKSHGDLTFRDTYIKRHHHHVQESASN
jgi:hypothetical protein